MAKKGGFSLRCILFGHAWRVDGKRVYCAVCGLEQ